MLKISIDELRGRSPCCARAAIGQAAAPEPRNELPPSCHSITSSAMASRFGGRLKPSVLAVFRLMMNSYLVGN
jgi:hypothetical protein